MGTFGKIVIGFIAIGVGSAVTSKLLGTQEKAEKMVNNLNKLNR